jgi:uncharacterized protein DUF6893
MGTGPGNRKRRFKFRESRTERPWFVDFAPEAKGSQHFICSRARKLGVALTVSQSCRPSCDVLAGARSGNCRMYEVPSHVKIALNEVKTMDAKTVAAVVVAGVVVIGAVLLLPDFVRYMKIRSM